MTESSITKNAAETNPDNYPLKKMVASCLTAGNMHTGDESAALFNGVREQTTDDEFENETWNVANMFTKNFDGITVKATPDVGAAGLDLNQAESTGDAPKPPPIHEGEL